MDIATLVNIASRAWSLAILAALHESVPGRQAQLLTATGAGRAAFAQSMTHLVDLGLVERNPGHGHPLRPEFRLTKPGHEAAIVAHAVTKAAATAPHRDLLRKAWTVPILAVLAEPRPFNAIGRLLRPITNRALSQALKSLEASGWVVRSVDQSARPPRAIYRAEGIGAAIAQAANADGPVGQAREQVRKNEFRRSPAKPAARPSSA